MRWLILAVLILLMLTAQTAAAPSISLLGARPDFLLILVVQIALVTPHLEGVIWAWGIGLLVDLHDGLPPGVLALTYMVIAVTLYRIRSQVFAGHILTRLFLVMVAGFLAQVAAMFSEIILGHPLDFVLFWRTALVSMAYTVVAALALLPLLSLLLRRLYVERRFT